MKAAQLIQKIEKLPLFEKKEVEDFVEFLLYKKAKKIDAITEREFGFFKGKIKISDDFDAPISDFNEYML